MKLKYTFTATGDVTNPCVVINLPAGLTIRSRKLHRACLNYNITGGYVKDSQNDLSISFCTAYDNWVTRAAIKRGRNQWLAMHRELFKTQPQLKPKWHDYKPALHYDQFQEIQPIGLLIPTLTVPKDFNNQDLPHDPRGITWSVFTTEDSTHTNSAIDMTEQDQWTTHIVGPHDTDSGGNFKSIGLIESWENSRPDIEPVTTVDSAEMTAIQNDPLNLLFNDGSADNQIIDSFENAIPGNGLSEGDMFPMYSNSVINSLEEVAATFTTEYNPISYFTGFTALTGQVYLKVNGSMKNNENFEVVFEVDPRGMTI